MNGNAKATVMASFVGDAISLGAHWIYETSVIDDKFGRIEDLVDPLPDSFHAARQKGELTHYGDAMLCLLESIEKCSGFNLNFFSEKWQELFQDYDGYYDKATKQTLNNLQKQKEPENAGSSSTDLAGASRLAPLFYVYSDNYQMLIKSCREQTAMTHNHPQVIAAAEFFAHIVWHILRDTRPTAAIKLAIEEKFSEGEIAFWAQEGLSTKDRETRSTIFNFGQMCDIKGAFPSVIHLIARYENDLETALIENVMAGGDSAARGLITGAVLGAHLGLDAIPEKWLNGLKCKNKVERLLENLYQENMA